MANDRRAYLTTLLTLWTALSAIAWFYSKQQNIPSSIATWLAAAFLVETAFYLAPGFKWTRSLADSIQPPAVRAFILTLTALAPYLIYSLGTGTFHWRNFGLLALIATFVSAWFVAQKSTFADLIFVAALIALTLSKVFDGIYITLANKADAWALGYLMLIHTGALSVLSIRKMSGINFGFLPTGKEWITGVIAFALAIPVAIAANSVIHFKEPRLANGPWWTVAALAAGTFITILWVTALSEEFIFRGILQQTLSTKFGKIAGLALTSLAFGAVHLPFAHQFPNWRFAAMATILGVIYGLAYIRTGGIRAPMVTHALVVASWRVFFA